MLLVAFVETNNSTVHATTAFLASNLYSGQTPNLHIGSYSAYCMFPFKQDHLRGKHNMELVVLPPGNEAGFFIKLYTIKTRRCVF